MIEEKYLKYEELTIYNLRSLYAGYGYLPFKMSKFEEYELYVKNKDFLVSDSVITFNDTNGKLLALKPDVTLSIIKNGQDEKGVKQKVFYSENVYRISGSTRQFKEIMQTGLECIGDIDQYDVFEVLTLACASLETISSDYVIELSHLGVLSALLDSVNTDDSFKMQIMDCIKQKNSHEIKKICAMYSVSEDDTRLLCDFVSIYGKADLVLERLSQIELGSEYRQALNELKALVELLDKTVYKDKIRLDFSIVNDMNYYNGIVFNGFINGVCETVMFGGRYDKLLNKMGRKSKGIGFAIYVDLLEELDKDYKGYDVDALILYDANTSVETLSSLVNEYRQKGQSVTAQKAIPEKIRYKELVDITGEIGQ
ncbi:MAG: ATP phosphoribosyltransferase regulatory subunit [Clostridia bacterium]|nr:ATP phosphoribosyltransferase regulatory subunit [Clostridia bacterium]